MVEKIIINATRRNPQISHLTLLIGYLDNARFI